MSLEAFPAVVSVTRPRFWFIKWGILRNVYSMLRKGCGCAGIQLTCYPGGATYITQTMVMR
jgi:hypothetical protein